MDLRAKSKNNTSVLQCIAVLHASVHLVHLEQDLTPNSLGLKCLRLAGHVSSIFKAFSNKKLLGAPGIATRSKDASRGSWPYY